MPLAAIVHQKVWFVSGGLELHGTDTQNSTSHKCKSIPIVRSHVALGHANDYC